MSPRSPYGLALSQLTDELTGFSYDPDLQGEEWLRATLVAMATTPEIWPMTHSLYELLLAWAGFDLADAEAIGSAVQLTKFGIGAGLWELVCDHGDEPSPFCVRLASDEADKAEAAGLSARETEPLSGLRVRRRVRALELERRYKPEGRGAA